MATLIAALTAVGWPGLAAPPSLVTDGATAAITAPTTGNAPDEGGRAAAAPGFFGVATTQPDGALCLRLRSAEPGRPVAELYQCYGLKHPDFEMVREHVGPIRPGEEKLIRPFP